MQIQESVTISFERYDRMQAELQRLKEEVYRLGEWKKNEIEFTFARDEHHFADEALARYFDEHKGKVIRIKLAAQ